VLNVVALLVVLKLISTSAFGIASIVLAIFSILRAITELGLGVAIVQAQDITREEIDSLFWLSLVVSGSIYLLLLASAPLVGWLYGEPQLTELLQVRPVRHRFLLLLRAEEPSHEGDVVRPNRLCRERLSAELLLVGGYEKYFDAISLVYIFALMGVLRTVAALVPQLLNAVGQAQLNFFYSLFSSVLMPVAFLIGGQFSLEGVAWSWMAAYPFVVLLLFYFSAQVLDLSLPAVLAKIAPGGLCPFRPWAWGWAWGWAWNGSQFDPESLDVKWHASDPFIAQHDPDFIGDGWIAVFDNQDDGTGRGSLLGGSRIVAVQPHTDSTKVLFPTEHSEPFTPPARDAWRC
jgi:hypothetical protein